MIFSVSTTTTLVHTIKRGMPKKLGGGGGGGGGGREGGGVKAPKPPLAYGPEESSLQQWRCAYEDGEVLRKEEGEFEVLAWGVLSQTEELKRLLNDT